MKEEDLIKRLEEVELPEIELPSHRRQLKMALLESDYFGKRQINTFWALTEEKIKRGIGNLVLRRPVWQTVLASILVVVLSVVLSIALPSLLGQSKEVLAAEIARNSLEVNAALGSDQVSEIEVVEIKDDLATVIVHGMLGTTLTVEVDLLTEIVTEVIGGLQLTDEEKSEALNILGSDPRFQELLSKGASIYAILPMEVRFMAMNPETGEVEEIVETWAQVWINLGDKQYGAQVDLIRGKVENLSD